MGELTGVQVRDFVIVALALLAAYVLLTNAYKAYKELRKPQEDFTAWRRSVDQRLANDNDRLKSMEQGNKVICRGILALLSHEINGNSTEKLKASQQEMTDYLIER